MIFRISICKLRCSKVTESVVGGWGRLALLSTSYPELCDIGQVTCHLCFHSFNCRTNRMYKILSCRLKFKYSVNQSFKLQKDRMGIECREGFL